MTDSDVVGNQNQYSYGEWVDGKTYPDWLRLARKSEWSEINTDNNLMFCHYDDYFYFWENGKVYNNAGANIYTLPWNFPIRNCVRFGDNFLMFYNTGNAIRIARCPFLWLSPDFTAVTVQRWIDEALSPFQATFSSAVWPYCQYINDSEDVLFFIAGNSAYRIIVTTAPFIQKGVVFEDQCVWITKNWSQITIYLSKGKKYFWDWFSKQHDWYVETGENIRYVQDTRNYDYIIAWNNASIYSKLYISQWQDFQLVKKWAFTVDWFTEKRKHAYWMEGRYGNFCIWIDEDNVYLSCDWQDRSIEWMGNKIVWFPKSTTTEYYNDNILDWGMIWRKDNWDMWFSYKDINWDAKISEIQTFRTNSPKYVEQWTLYTQKFSMQWERNRMKIWKIRCDTPAWTSISLYQSIDWSQNYQLIRTITATDKDEKIYSVPTSLPFYEIQLKIVMTTSNESITPILYSIRWENEQIER